MVKSDVYSSPIVFSQLDLRVKAHPNSERHYIETVDIGKGEELEMVMEHQPYFAEEELVDRKVVVVRTRSTGAILLVANDKGKVELLDPSPEAEIGERVYASGEELQDPVTPIQMKKNKCEITYLDRYPVRSRAGPVRVESLKKVFVTK
ncbi:hypothetical protein PInf_022587 [Phytophthora infestans]|nr:hypothetical protein PInf_022587 [Phytophthora infestans]